MSLTKDQVAELLLNQQKLIQLLAKQQEEQSKESHQGNKSTTTNVNIDLANLQFDTFNPKTEKFSCYLLRLQNYFDMKKLTNDKDEAKKAKTQILINSIGPKYIQLLMNLTAPEDPRTKSFEDLVELLKINLAPPPNIFSEQHKFLSRQQNQNETLAEYVAALQELALTCEWTCPHQDCGKPITPVVLRAQFIRGLHDVQVCEKLLQQPNQKELSVNKVVEIAQSVESSKAENKNYAKPINSLRDNNRDNKSDNNRSRNRNRSANRSDNRDRSKNRYYSQNRGRYRSKSRVDFKELGIDKLCLCCGRDNHLSKDCRVPKIKLNCKSCNRTGHTDKVCITTLLKSKSKSVKQLSDDEDEEVHLIQTIGDGSEKIMRTVMVNGQPVKLECDCGSRYTVLSEKFFNQLNIKSKLLKDNTKFRDYTGNRFVPIGYINVKVQYKDRSIEDVKLYITNRSDLSVMGREWLLPLRIIIVDDEGIASIQPELENEDEISAIIESIKAEFPEVFENAIGVAPNYVVSFPVKEGTVPIYKKARKIPYQTVDKADRCINRLEHFGVLEQVTTSDWGTTGVYVEKSDGSLRLVGNYKQTINKYMEDNRYPMTSIDDVFTKLGDDNQNNKVFCKVDLLDAYLHLAVDEQTAKLQTLVTHRGAYRVNRMYPGSKRAAQEFQRFMDQILRDLAGVIAFFDDILVMGKTIQECLDRLRKLLQRLKENNLHVNLQKCQFFVKSVTYLGHTIDENGIHTSEEKVEAVLKARRPENSDEVRQFTGLVNYYAKFIKNVSHILHPLNRLTQKNVKFEWTKECEQAFQQIKQAITTEQVLHPYRKDLPLLLATDACEHGISAVLSHRLPDGSERPIYFKSKSLTKSEQNYSQLNREALALYWGSKKFFYYIYGRPFTYIIDCKALLHIMSPDKDLPSHTASRMLRYASFISQFDYKFEHRPSKEHANADYLSRFPLPIEDVKFVDDCAAMQIQKLDEITLSAPVSAKQIKIETDADPELIQLKKDLQFGKNIDPEYSLNDGIIFKNDRIYIPAKLRPVMLQELHDTHIGIVKMKTLARNYVWWPGIDREIETMVKSCINCADFAKSPKKAPLHQWEPPQKNFQRIHMDYAGPFKNHHYFIIIDAKSKWIEVYVRKNDPNTECTCAYLQEFFARFGIPEELVSDNASIFTSDDFQKFTQFYGINHRLIAPGKPATNGQAERAVQIIKSKLKKANISDDTKAIKSAVANILRIYRVTPASTGLSPSEAVFGEKISIRLDRIRPSKPVTTKKSSLKTHTFRLGERVQSRNYSSSKLWKYGTIVEKLGNLHYLVELDDGYTIKRHIDQLKSTEIPKPTKDSVPEKKVAFQTTCLEKPSPPAKEEKPLASKIKSPIKSTIKAKEVPVPVRKSERTRKPAKRLDL